MALTRSSGRAAEDIRTVTIQPHFSPYAEGSCLICVGNTHVVCTASVDEKCPISCGVRERAGLQQNMACCPELPIAEWIEKRTGKQSGRTQEIQRLIGRSLRAIIDLEKLGERQIKVDCDVIRADGGTRTASITGAWVALSLAIEDLMQRGLITAMPLRDQVAAISCGIVGSEAIADLDYTEDSNAETDANFVLTASGGIVEIQGTAEQHPFSEEQLMQMMSLAKTGCQDLFAQQMQAAHTAKP